MRTGFWQGNAAEMKSSEDLRVDGKIIVLCVISLCALRIRQGIFISVFNQLDEQNLFHNKFYFVPLHVSSTCGHHQEVKIVLHSLWYHHTETSEWSKFCFKISFISCLYMFRARVHHQEVKIALHSLWYHHTYRWPSHYFMPLHVSSTCAHHQEARIALHSLWYHHTYRCDDTRGCVMQF